MVLISRRYPFQDAHSCQNKVHDVLYTLYVIRYTLYLIRYTLYVILYTFYVIRYTLYVLRYTFYVIRVTLYVKQYSTVQYRPDFFPRIFFHGFLPRIFLPRIFVSRSCFRIVFPDFRSQRCPGLNFQAQIRKKIPTL